MSKVLWLNTFCLSILFVCCLRPLWMASFDPSNFSRIERMQSIRCTYADYNSMQFWVTKSVGLHNTAYKMSLSISLAGLSSICISHVNMYSMHACRRASRLRYLEPFLNMRLGHCIKRFTDALGIADRKSGSTAHAGTLLYCFHAIH